MPQLGELFTFVAEVLVEDAILDGHHLETILVSIRVVLFVIVQSVQGASVPGGTTNLTETASTYGGALSNQREQKV